jgi:PD-(D/E)XK nuclease superfamily/Domain of unknown function (DUF2357)
MNSGLASVAGSIFASRNVSSCDTPPNRFVKYALADIHAFLLRAQSALERDGAYRVSAELAKRLANKFESLPGKALFQEVGQMTIAPLGSPVLQQKAGYRELLRLWLRFRTSAELSWEGGADVFYAGQRDVATLYEYWLFWVLLDWFFSKCSESATRPELRQLVDGLEEGAPTLKLKKRTHLGPFIGRFSKSGRRLHAQFDYNRAFPFAGTREGDGSWTRRLHPDYTLTFWPEQFTYAEALEKELLVHVHFDAKYRVESLEKLFGRDDTEEDTDAEDSGGNYKRQDLLKMHAYRDAIRRSQGAYILYPGSDSTVFKGFHEILPGLGAFGIAPDEHGKPEGLSALDDFLSDVLTHISSQTTARERVSYHIGESYRETSSDELCEASNTSLTTISESDALYAGERALPPAEHLVLAAWYETEAQLQLASNARGIVYVRLGTRRGALHVHPNFARTRHVLLRTHGGIAAQGLLVLREDGYRVYTRQQLRDVLRQLGAQRGTAAWEATEQEGDNEAIYAVFQVAPDPTFASCQWDGSKVMEVVEAFESKRRNRLAENLGRTSPYPRLLPLKQLLQCVRQPEQE